MKITVLSSGPLTTVQDLGRFGQMNTGFSPNGAMDSEAMIKANLLVGNRPEEATLEMTAVGMEAEFDGEGIMALTGADMSAKLNGQPIERYCSISVKKGDVLSMSAARVGLRAYLAFAGGLDVPLVLGSRSTNLKCALGGYQGRKLQKGDCLFTRKEISVVSFEKRSVPCSDDVSGKISLHVLLGPQDDYFTDEGKRCFFTSEYRVSPMSDRMGVRLDGEKIENKNGVDIISDGIVTGSVQIPPSGTPIIMMADHQTTGGYAKIATVLQKDLGKLAQARPGDLITFHGVSEEMAILFYREQMLTRKRLEARYSPLWEKEKE